MRALARFLVDHDPVTVAVGGDSAGGGLALSAVCALRDAGGPMPAAIWLQSPWTDLTGSGLTENMSGDPFITRELYDEVVGLYLHGADTTDWRRLATIRTLEA